MPTASKRLLFPHPFAATICTMCFLAIAWGCGGPLDSSISGTVTLDGKPLTTGTITLYPVKSGPLAYGNIQSDGTYKIATGQSTGLFSGEYKVGVVAIDVSEQTRGMGDPLGKLITPKRYRDPEKSGLRLTVKPGGNRYDIEMHSSAEPAAK